MIVLSVPIDIGEIGKGLNIWDRFVHAHPEKIKGGSTGDIAADSYHRYRDDVNAAAELGLHFYRFSINWVRILPNGFTNEFNEAGAKYYSDLIDALLAKGVEPVITLYHWDLPVKIQDMGGWTNPHIIDWFGDYARVIYSLYADRVKTWLTINEAIVVCDYMYNTGIFAPGIKESVYAPFLCNKHILLAHAKAYRIFDREFRPKYQGRVSLANNILWIEPATKNDTALAELGRQHSAGRYCHPIMSKKGGWPPTIKKLMLEYSLKEGFSQSRLPAFTKEEINFMKGTADFLGLNHYATYLIRPAKSGENIGFWFINGSPELNAILEKPSNSYYGASPILPVYPEGLRRQLKWLHEEYNGIDILITENGFSTIGHKLNDYARAGYIKENLEQVLLSIKKDNVSVIGYTVWSLIDNFEWSEAYSIRFGLYEIDFEDPKRLRKARLSADFYRCVIKNHSLTGAEACLKQKKDERRYKRMHLSNGSDKLPKSVLLIFFILLKFILS
ncbi:unnamed protein product, partial [Brenthis ino]